MGADDESEARESAFALACASHTPLMHGGECPPAIRQTVCEEFQKLASAIEAFAPDCIVQFSPDHFNGFSYDVMPSFCIGLAAESFGDYRTAKGALPVDADLGRDLLAGARDAELDVAVSYRMVVDHGFVQVWEASLGSFDRYPIVPIFINCAAPPLPSYKRARQLGQAIGAAARASGKRILFAGSGGLSHDPPIPNILTAAPDVRERLITGGRRAAPEVQLAKEERVFAVGRLAARGEGPALPLSPEWDHRFLNGLRAGDLQVFDAFDAVSVSAVAGCGGNEVLCWIAAFAALQAVGPYAVTSEFYEPIAGWMSGMAMVTARPVSAATPREMRGALD